ncbi:CLUMA_CG009501, isoform A [Clunio marinus]|uniref:CLUMA_CG009501, isoform A n=1 Tax=Clunio marinus TaxID=568069 RepID=A0A1J1ICA5_9DIPT|nr:CLUMA_CG009501, isoform A [Clunio marinus]
MSSAVSSTNVPSTPILVTTPSNDTKPSFNDHKRDDSNDDDQRHLNKQNSNKTYTRGNSNKSKQLTRSHAMKESASPPRTPNSHSPNDMKSHSPTAPTLVTTSSENINLESPSSQLLTAPPTFILPQSESVGGKSQLDIEFPKLTPPKTKVGWSSSPPGSRNHNRKSVSSDTSSNNNSLSEDISESQINDKTSQQQQKTGSQIISTSTASNQSSHYSSDKKSPQQIDNECEQSSVASLEFNKQEERERVIISPSRAQCRSPNYHHQQQQQQNDNNNNNGSKSTTNSVVASYINVKGKPPLKNMGSSSSCEGGNTSSGFISRDSSSEQFVDQNGIDLVQFFKETLNKNVKDRNMLMKIERDLTQLAVDQTGRTFIKFPPMSSYNRMLVHRTAAYFGMDHNFDSAQLCVIASITKETRLPDIRFKTLIRDTFSEEPRKSILKREAHSFEDYRQGGLLSVHRGILNRKAKSFEERDEEYDKVRRRIFRNREVFGGYESVDEQEWQWMQQERNDTGGDLSTKLKVPNRMIKVHASSMEGRYGERNPSVSKSHSFGGYGGPNNNTLMRDDSISSNKSTGSKIHKQDSSASTTWRLSPSSSGYKTQSLRSDSVTPSPTGYGSDTPEPPSQSPDRGVVWAVTDLASVPKGSLIIDPHTLQPILNQDGSLYHFDPSNPPTKAGRYGNSGNSRKKPDRQRSLNNAGKPNYRDSTDTNNINTSGTSESDKSVVLISNKPISKVNTSDFDDQTDTMPIEAPKPCENSDDTSTTKEVDSCESNSSQIDVKSQSSYLNTTEETSPKQKNQSTSPNLPLNEKVINEEEESVTPTSSIQAIEEIGNEDDAKKDDVISTSATATPPVQEIRYQSNPYVNTTNPAVTPTLSVMGYAPPPVPFSAPVDPAGTIYHTGENEVANCWVPIFDQGALQSRDPNMTTVMPVSYQPTPASPYSGPTTLYQSPVVYSADQFPNQPAIAGQYPMSYPMGYATYPVNGAPYQNFWPQPMTYFLPQPTATPTPVLVPPGAPPTSIQSTPSVNSHNPSTNSGASGRRSSPPSAHNNNTNNNSNTTNSTSTPGLSSIHTTAVPLQTFPSSVPLSLATTDNNSGSGPQALYAIPPSVYPNVLPYGTQPAAGFYQPLPHHPPANTTIISSVIPHSNAHPTGLPSTPHTFQSNVGHVQGAEVLTHFPFNQPPQNMSINNVNMNSNVATTSTPQSAPSTPLSLTTVQPSFKNPPLFATPPIIATSTIPASVHIAHYDDSKKQHYSGSGYATKKYNNSGGILNTPTLPPPPNNSIVVKTQSSNGNQRQSIGSGYQSGMQGKKNVNYNGGNNINNNNNNNSSNNNNNNSTSSHTNSEDTNSLSNSNMSSNYNSNRVKNSSNRDQTSAGSSTVSSGGVGGGSGYQTKSTYVSKGHHQHQNNYSANNNGSNSNSPNSNDNSEGNKYVSQPQQQQHRGPSRPVPPSLDLKRNNNNNNTNVVTNSYHHHHQRSTPSTNSTESNNSPNSITSFDHSRNYHYSQYPSTSGGTHFYRGGSAGAISAISAGMQMNSNPNNTSGDGTSIQTCFPFNVHSQNTGASSTPLIDSCHHQLIGYNTNPMATGMYVKFGQAFTFANPMPNNRKSPSNDIRQPLAPLAGVYSTMNMVLPGGPRQMNPRSMHNNHNYKGNRTQR